NVCNSYAGSAREFVKMRTAVADRALLLNGSANGSTMIHLAPASDSPSIPCAARRYRAGSKTPLGGAGEFALVLAGVPCFQGEFRGFRSFPRFGLTGAIKPATCG